MKHVSTLFLKAVLVVIAIAVLVIPAMLLPHVWPGSINPEYTTYMNAAYPGVFGIYATIIPFLFALFQAFRLLQNIDRNNAFSESSVKALNGIKYSAIAMTLLYALAQPMIFIFAELDDAPGVILVGWAITGAPLIVATFAAVLQKLVRSAIDLKTENDLTV
jgi:hypothetical protein